MSNMKDKKEEFRWLASVGVLSLSVGIFFNHVPLFLLGVIILYLKMKDEGVFE